MPLALNSRAVGKVTVVECAGRIVAGNETESLRTHISGMMRDRKNFVLHLGEVNFIDSSGLGAMVRLLTSTRQVHGDLKLCNLPQNVHKVLKLTNLTTLFDTHESEDHAIAAFYCRGSDQQQAPAGPAVLCIHQNGDVLAYLRELLKQGGYEVHTSSSLRDALILMRVTRPVLLLISPNLTGTASTQEAFTAARSGVPVIELSNEFSTLEASEAATQLLESIQARLQTKTGAA
jgi:anti-sigma B factor antagonist